MKYDLLLKSGRLLDGSHGGEQLLDLAFAGGRIAAVSSHIPAANATRVLDVDGKFVTPGLIDFHTHVYWWTKRISIDPDKTGPASGVTTVVDCGTAGPATFAGLRAYAQQAKTRIFCFVHISAIGLTYSHNVPELVTLDFASVKGTARVVELNRDMVLGVKVRLGSRAVPPEHERRALALAKEAATLAGVPLMVHMGASSSPLSDVLPVLERGDVLTHCYCGHANGILDEGLKVLPAVWEASKRGVIFDLGYAHGFSHRVAESAISQGLVPDVLSTDLVNHPPMVNLPAVMAIMMAHGLTLQQVVNGVTERPASLIRGITHGPDVLGALTVGAVGDIAVWTLNHEGVDFTDKFDQVRHGTTRFELDLTIKDGQPWEVARSTR